MTQDEAYQLMEDCVREIQKRLVINLPKFEVQMVSKDGIKKLKPIAVKSD